MNLIEENILIEIRLEQSTKHSSSNDITLPRITMDVSEMHPLKQHFGIDFIKAGILIVKRFLQFKKQHSPKD
jgi:hypothetical protein